MNATRRTRTYATSKTVVIPRANGIPMVFSQDFSFLTNTDLPAGIDQHLDPNHVRVFATMADYTHWLQEVGGVCGDCICIEAVL